MTNKQTPPISTNDIVKHNESMKEISENSNLLFIEFDIPDEDFGATSP